MLKMLTEEEFGKRADGAGRIALIAREEQRPRDKAFGKRARCGGGTRKSQQVPAPSRRVCGQDEGACVDPGNTAERRGVLSDERDIHAKSSRFLISHPYCLR